ncbi:MAG: hypothetical protein K2P81_10890 [Bacteriovoracaceae bacterium]|nr:hypothetical protein [Bacteriovoracaceae bacterium]
MSQTEFKKRDLSVAILMEDAISAQEISEALREVGIFAHYYRELDEFWMAAKIEVPDLAIVDVAKMSFGATKFKDHPRVKDGSLTTVFYHKTETQFLLQSTFSLHAYAYVHGETALVPQVTAICERRKKELAMEIRNRELEERVSRLQTRSSRLISEKSAGEQFKAQFEFIDSMIRSLEEEASSKDFVAALFEKFSQWEPVRHIAMYELGHNRQKLVSPAIHRPKWITLPGLWIGKDCQQGIEPFAIDMGWQVVRDLFENEPVELKLLGGAVHPDMLIYVEVDQERLMEFPWDLMGQMLTGAYRRWKLTREMPRPQMQARPVWDALDQLDKLHHHQVEASEKIVLISLTPLMNLIKKKTGNRFHFTPCFNDFFLQLGNALHESTRFSFMGPWHVVLFVQQPFLERDFNQARDLVTSFAFWRYFEDETKLLGEEAKPTIKLIAPSAVNYLRVLEREFDELPILEAQAKMQMRNTTNPAAH